MPGAAAGDPSSVRTFAHRMNVLSTMVTPLQRMDYTGESSLLSEVKAKLGAANPDK